MDDAVSLPKSSGSLRPRIGLAVTGCLGMVLGALGLATVLTVPAAGISAYGALLVISGALQLGELGRPLGRGDWLVRMLVVVAYVACGAVLVFDPAGAAMIEAAAALLFVTAGALRMGWAVGLPSSARARAWANVAGMGSILLGALVLVGPSAIDWLVGAAAALDMALWGAGAVLRAQKA